MYSRESESYRQTTAAMRGWHAMRAALRNISARAGARWLRPQNTGGLAMTAADS